MKIQIIGLPCSGKTTAIKEFLKEKEDILYIDIKDYEGKKRQGLYRKAIQKASKPIIAESACGVNIRNTHIIRLEVPVHLVYTRSMNRDHIIDEDYMSLLEGQMLPAKYTVTTKEALIKLLNNLLT